MPPWCVSPGSADCHQPCRHVLARTPHLCLGCRRCVQGAPLAPRHDLVRHCCFDGAALVCPVVHCHSKMHTCIVHELQGMYNCDACVRSLFRANDICIVTAAWCGVCRLGGIPASASSFRRALQKGSVGLVPGEQGQLLVKCTAAVLQPCSWLLVRSCCTTQLQHIPMPHPVVGGAGASCDSSTAELKLAGWWVV